MSRVLLFAPNAGVSFSTGGGSGLGMKLALALLEAGHQVTLAGYHAYDLPTLDTIHGTNVCDFGKNVTLRSSSHLNAPFSLYRSLPVKLSAYSMIVSQGFQDWVADVIREVDPDCLVFQDDIPRSANPFLAAIPTFLYVHFPFAGLSERYIPQLRSILTRLEWANDRFLQLVSQRFLVNDPRGAIRRIWTNSTITANVVEQLWPGLAPEYLPTYSSLGDSNQGLSRRESRFVSLGTIQKAKGHLALIEAVARSQRLDPSISLTIAGHARDRSYLARLRAAAANAPMPEQVRIRVDVTRPELLAELDSAVGIIQPAYFEPFGLALLEGMGRGCAAIAQASEVAGGWVDILERGKWGLGFRDLSELSTAITEVAQNRAHQLALRTKALTRASAFSKTMFRHRIEEAFQNIGRGS